MTFKFVLAAALAVVGVSPALASPAAAAPVAATAPLSAAAWEPQRTIVHERTVVRRGPGYGRHGYRDRVRTRRVCTNRWRHGERVRVCRTVRRYR
ncbi:MAG: hypothetical protein EOP67_70310 [Sphingomonas sp.]|jgi:Ni/Co efflux regulator RcnB|uniref:Uncharacterized protein n=1 Tax=Sphingomonas longa TaxID=2778730 RepID=A0ABS2DBW6_9SPHN|nr:MULTISPECIES: hypothetical protein [Alphaproteobacteria]MBM6578425.1 hypothetical protein [Sphingomonas sp. BT552]MBR7711465.1 hypothetical protein [Microvirga sp. SRT01]RZM09303.1 MAG: hypothetical protein EOP67_70310 [Sphingomonas sp.]